MVERKFKDSGLVTDLQLLGMRSMAELLDNITRHGVLYAAVVTTQHEIHRSVTINILHGTQQGKRCWLLCTNEAAVCQKRTISVRLSCC